MNQEEVKIIYSGLSAFPLKWFSPKPVDLNNTPIYVNLFDLFKREFEEAKAAKLEEQLTTKEDANRI